MKFYFFLIGVFISCKPIGTKESIKDKGFYSSYCSIINDTFYLIKEDFPVKGEYRYRYYYHVYETWDSTSYTDRVYPQVKDSTFSFANNAIRDAYNYEVKKIDIGDVPTHWTEVIYSCGKYYLSSPSDRCGLKQKIISDSCLINFFCEGPYPDQLLAIEKLDSITYEGTTGIDFENTSSFKISIVDSARGIAIWEDSSGKHLFAHTDKYRNLPIAIDDCNGNKCFALIQEDTVLINQLLKDIKR